MSRGKLPMARRRRQKPEAPAASGINSPATGPIKPLPTPVAILNLPDTRDVHRARTAWNLANELYQLLMRLRAWLYWWEETGNADPSLPAQWGDDIIKCFVGLWRLGVNSGSFSLDERQATEFLE